jgi:hypothetical protein
MKKLILVTAILYSIFANAEAVYPDAIPLRVFGSDQGPVGSCASEARITALEHYISHQGVAIKLSLRHFHARLWQHNPTGDKIFVNYTAQTNQILDRYDFLVPEYMQPEDGEGIEYVSNQGTRPPLEVSGLYDPQFPNPSQFRYSETFFVLKGGYTNSVSLDALKNFVRQHRPVVLSIDSEILYDLDDITGLPDEKKPIPQMKEIHHDVAVVGFDDDIQSLIIRNTWNDRDAINVTASADASDAKKHPKLTIMKLKIAKRNLPGYYAIPYQTVLAAAQLPGAGFYVLDLDAGAFANAYYEFQEKYSTQIAPYKCAPEFSSPLSSVKKYFNDFFDPQGNQNQKEKAARIIQYLIVGQTDLQTPTFSFAKIPALKIDANAKLREFYSGSMLGYYCAGTSSSTSQKPWPFNNPEVLNNENFYPLLHRLSNDPKAFITWRDFFEMSVGINN